MSVVKRLLPNGEWMDFTLETNTTIQHWSSPTIYKFYEPYYTYPWYSATGPYYYANGAISSTNATGGTLNMNASNGISASYSAGNANTMMNSSKTLESGSDLNATLKDGIYNVQV
jgi:hypothetical protein